MRLQDAEHEMSGLSSTVEEIGALETEIDRIDELVEFVFRVAESTELDRFETGVETAAKSGSPAVGNRGGDEPDGTIVSESADLTAGSGTVVDAVTDDQFSFVESAGVADDSAGRSTNRPSSEG